MDRARLIGAAAALLLATAVAAAPARAALDAGAMYEPTTVVAIDLQLPPESVAALEAEPAEYVEGTFALAESAGTPDSVGEPSDPIVVGVRLKGTKSFRGLDGKAAFKVKFNEFVGGQKFLGLKSLTLNNMVQDPSMIREAIAYEAFRAAGVLAPRAGYAYVRLNGIDYGLHLNLETMDDVALERSFGAFGDPQHLYEGQPEVDVLPGNAAGFEVDEGDEDDRSDLEALIAAAAAAGSPGYSERMAPVADLAQMTTMWAAERYLDHWDGYAGPIVSNYYLYGDAAGVFQMLPWGTDQAMQVWWRPFTGEGGTLFEQCLAEPACAGEFRRALVAVGGAAAALELPTRAGQLAALLAPWQGAEIAGSARAPFSVEQIEQGVADVIEFFERRPRFLAEWLGEGTGGTGGVDGPALALPQAGTGPAAAASEGLSKRLGVDRSRLSRGQLRFTVSVPGPGTVTQRAEILTAAGPVGACSTSHGAKRAGSLAIACGLSGKVRRHLTARWLRLRVRLGFQPWSGGAAAQLVATVLLPREAGAG